MDRTRMRRYDIAYCEKKPLDEADDSDAVTAC